MKSAPTSIANLTTNSVPVADRLDFWREQFTSCVISRPPNDTRADFRSELLRCADSDGTSFLHIRGDPLICGFGKRESGLVLVGCVRSGTFEVSHDDERTTVLDSNSGLILLDCDRRFVTSSTRYELAQLALPRSLIMSVLGPRPVLRDKAVVKLPENGLTPILLAHLDAMSRYGTELDKADAAAAMHSMASLAIAMLSRLARGEDRKNELDEYLFAAARRYIEAHASRHDLTAARIAAAIGCSRARLYRLFADRSMFVAGLLREIRLTRARALIETYPGRPVGQTAFDCGYSDLSTFGKAFKRRYGMSPIEYRGEVVRENHPHFTEKSRPS
ncbi:MULTISPECIES: AraC family transcriptional regulator [unclassified Mesorhizobium]|uniref:AraC family transcriptional regulator n=1 Tax=unclassified Mesorhizobium TaxID=325217 RepID=UPI00117D34CF|nr:MULTISPECIES: AraC family transcriptional regulator [unclassified Mesorhizobium]